MSQHVPPVCLTEQGSDLCAVLEGRLRSFSTCESPLKEVFLGEFWEQLPGGLECQRALDVCSGWRCHAQGLGFPAGAEPGAAPAVWGTRSFCFSSGLGGKSPGRDRKTVWIELGTDMRQDRMCEKMNADRIKGGVKRIVQVLHLLGSSKSLSCARGARGGEAKAPKAQTRGGLEQTSPG